MSISSGHDTGKTGLLGMLAGWLMATRDGLRGTVTANTSDQLSTKTWAEIQTWKKRLICAHWFEINSERFYRTGRKSDWFMAPQSPAEENSEAFAGQHAVTSSSVYIFDEASKIADKIWEVALGGTVDGESMWFPFGNPTRREGWFFDINFGKRRSWWNSHTQGPSQTTDSPAGTRVWDSRDSPFANQEHIGALIQEWGDDSDLVRVRVYGKPPKAGDIQFIPQDWIEAAQKRVPRALSDDPLIAGCDLAWGGSDAACIRFRRGLDAQTIPPIKIPGELCKDDAVMVMKLTDVLSTSYHGRKVDMLFIDSAGACGPIVRRLRELGHRNIIEVNFGAHSPSPKYKLMRSYMWGQLKEALPYLSIDKSPDLEADLAAPAYSITNQTEILLESKQLVIKRLGHSTDDGDALALTFAMPVAPKIERRETEGRYRPRKIGPWS